MAIALFLPDWIVADVHIDDDGAYQIAAHPDAPSVYCDKCDRRSELSPVDQKAIRCVDAPVHEEAAAKAERHPFRPRSLTIG